MTGAGRECSEEVLLTIERHRTVKRFTGIHLRVLVDGHGDVTDRCASADDEAGWACVYALDALGRKYLREDRRGPQMGLLTGTVVFCRRAERLD